MNQLLLRVLKIYLLIPLAVAFLTLDSLGGFGILKLFPSVPEKLLLFNFFFNLPHIIASNLLLIDGEVYSQYGRKISIFFVASILVTLVFHYYFKTDVFIYLHSLWTLKHVIMQQFNLSHAYGMKKSVLTHVWKWLGVFAGLIVYWDIYDFYDFQKMLPFSSVASASLVLLFALTSVYLLISHRRDKSSLYIFANSSLILVSFIFYKLGAGFISVLLIRVIHDCTGFIFYQALNEGKFKAGKSSRFYAVMTNNFGSIIGTVLPPILIVVFFFSLPFRKEVISLLMVLSLMHYFSEGFTWKTESPYRKYF